LSETWFGINFLSTYTAKGIVEASMTESSIESDVPSNLGTALDASCIVSSQMDVQQGTAGLQDVTNFHS
jgi:hypothetical protein